MIAIIVNLAIGAPDVKTDTPPAGEHDTCFAIDAYQPRCYEDYPRRDCESPASPACDTLIRRARSHAYTPASTRRRADPSVSAKQRARDFLQALRD
jgi:hypothetical protein